MISYSLKTFSADPMGSTNYGKLSNVSIVHDFSQDCKNAASATAPTGYDFNGNAGTALTFCSAAVRPIFPQNYRAITLSINRNVARIANGSLGHPSL
jgi:hypothetical protein